MYEDENEDRTSTRWICILLAVISLAGISGRIANVHSKDRKTPFFSANDRSRWCTILSLGEFGTYEIDRIIKRKTWDSIDKVRHVGRDGELHYYSSKPPLYATMLAGEYWLVKKITGASLRKSTFYVVRVMLFLTNVLPLVLYFWLIVKIGEEFAETDWARIYLMVAACFATFLTTFANSINNHLPAAISVLICVYAFVRIYRSESTSWRPFFIAGLASAFAAANELPALSFFAFATLIAVYLSKRQFLLGFLPGAAVVIAGFFGTNYAAHASFIPPYAHRSAEDNWYDYEGSYWSGEKQGVDKGEESKATYAFHVLIGHYGILSLTPIWLLSIIGAIHWIQRGEGDERLLAAVTVVLTIVCLTFYIALRPLKDRNYGGVSCGFRWMFWFIPLWLMLMVPTLDRINEKRVWQGFAIVLLIVSAFSAAYGSANPWVSPWLYEYWKSIGWI